MNSPDLRRTLIAGSIGNAMEWYDFGLYGYFAPVLAGLFFPSRDPIASIMSTFGVFAAGFLMRPVGAAIFGHYGDRLGRKKALAASVILMALPTAILGLLPTYAQIGMAAPLLLTLLRLVQGASTGGEFTGSITFLVEHAPPERRGFVGSLPTFSSVVGILLGSAIGALISGVLSKAEVAAWGWRIPFLLGILVGVIGLYMRMRIPESPEFERLADTGDVAHSPLREAFTHQRGPLLRVFWLNWLPGISFYTVFVFTTTYLTKMAGRPLTEALTLNTLALALMAVLVPAAGALSDRIGRKPLLLASIGGFLVASYPLFLLLTRGDFASSLAALCVFAALQAAFGGPMAATFAEIVPARARYTGLSVGYNLAVGIVGGSAPLVATYLIRETGNHAAPGLYMSLSALVTLAVALPLKETYRSPLQ